MSSSDDEVICLGSLPKQSQPGTLASSSTQQLPRIRAETSVREIPGSYNNRRPRNVPRYRRAERSSQQTPSRAANLISQIRRLPTTHRRRGRNTRREPRFPSYITDKMVNLGWRRNSIGQQRRIPVYSSFSQSGRFCL